jgi:uncharacterized RDD family membrane protein YckC
MNGITILDRANAPMGPFTREQIAEKLQRGEVILSSLAFIDGLAQWTPLRDVLARIDAANPPAPVLPTVPVSAPLAPTPAYSYAATMEPPAHLIYAGFWLRVLATLIDSVLLFAMIAVILVVWGVIFSLVVGTKNLGFHPPSDASSPNALTFVLMAIMEIVLIVAIILVGWFYHAFFESGPWQGTLGKRVLNLRITSMTGERITFWHATGRFLARTVAALPFCAGYIMAAFTPRKQALHDLIAGTVVVRR